MPLRYPAPCRRAASRASTPQAGIWVSDSMLSQAIERYQRHIAVPCRYLSSHSGPLESRRRMGKRHMTGLMQIQSTGLYPPVWQFEIASGTGIWQWEPPSTSKDRREKETEISASRMFNNFIGWLENSDAAKPFLQPPTDEVSVAFAAPAEALAIPAAEMQAEVQDTIWPQRVDAVDLRTEILNLRASILELEDFNEEALYRLCKTRRRSLRRIIERGDITVDGLLLALDPLDWQTRSRIPDQKTAQKITAMIHRTILSGMDAAQRTRDGMVSQELWMTLVNKICTSNAANHDIHLFRRLMHILPPSLRSQIPPAQLFDLSRSFVTAQANRHNLFSHWSARASRFANALQELNMEQRQILHLSMREFLQQSDESPETQRRLQFSWLLIRANDADLSRSEMIAACREYISAGLRLNGMQLWQLSTARLVASGMMTKLHHDRLMEVEHGSMSQRWTGLADTLLKSEDANSAVQELHSILHNLGETATLVRGLTSAPPSHLRGDIIQAVAIACNDHCLALGLYDATRCKDRTGSTTRHWHWTAWKPYIQRMINDPKLEPSQIWQALRLTRRHDIHHTTHQAAGDVSAKMELLDMMAQCFMKAPHLNDRQLLRRLEECVARQRSLTNKVSSKVMACVFEVVTQDLEKGQWGRTARIEWLLGMVAEAQGTKHADNAAKLLKGWRWVIDQENRAST